MSQADVPPGRSREKAARMPDREPTILFHVGAVPTAGWLIQRCLDRHAEQWNKIGVVGIPQAGLVGSTRSGANLTLDDVTFAATINELAAQQRTDVIAAAGNALGPTFGGPPGSGLHADFDEAITLLKKATQRYRRLIVLSICPQVQLLERHYARAIKSGSTATLDEWLCGIDLDNLSWLPLHEKLVAAFGSEVVVTCKLGDHAEAHTEFLREFFAAGDVELPEAIGRKTPRPVLGLSENGVRLAIAAHPHLTSARQRTELHAFLNRHFSELDGPRGTVLPPSVGSRINARYHDELQKLLAPESAIEAAGATR